MTLDHDRLKKSWALVADHGDQVPLFFYSTLFLHNPHLRDMFPVSMADQRDKLVAALGNVISGVDQLDAVVPVLQQLGRDHRKFAVVRDHYPAVGHALVATLEHFSGPEWTPELAHDWVTAYGIVADVMIGAAEAAADQPPWWELTVTDVERRAVDIAVLRVVPHQPLAYVAGQSIAVEVPQRPRLWRYLTPAGAPGADGGFELHVRVVAGGVVSTAIVQGTRAGDVWRAGAPVGTQLTLAPGPGPDLVMLAGGTGLAPMKALLAPIEADGRSVLWSSDTGPTQRLWEIANRTPGLSALAIDTSFNNSLQPIADISLHLTPRTLVQELEKLERKVPILLHHLKPPCIDEIRREIKELRNPDLSYLEQGRIYDF